MAYFRASIKFLFILTVVLGIAACSSEEATPKTSQTIIEYRDRPVASVSGEVSVPDGVDKVGLQIFAEGTSFSAFTDDQGQFVLGNLPVGEFRIRAMGRGVESTVLGNITVTAEDLEKDQPFHSLPRVFLEEDARGNTAANAAMIASDELGAFRGVVQTTFPTDAGGVLVVVQNTPHRTATLPDGSYQIPNIRPGDYTLEFSKVGFLQATVAVKVTKGQTLEVPQVRLRGASESPQSARTVFGQLDVLMADGSILNDFSQFRVALEGSSYAATPDSSGRFEIRGVAPSVYTVSASASGFILDSKVDVDVTNLPSANVVLTMLEDTTADLMNGTITGRVILAGAEGGDHAGVAISLIGTEKVAFSDRAGNYTLTEIPEGVYDIMTVKSGYETVILEGLNVSPPDVTRADDISMEKEVDPPYVVATIPRDGETNVVIQNPTRLTIQFSESMDIASVQRAFSLVPEVDYRLQAVRESGPGASSFTIDLNAVPRSGTQALSYDTQYRATISTAATNLEGTALESTYNFTFKTGPAMIIATNPADGSEGFVYRFDDYISIFFNAPIDRETIDADDITFRPALNGKANIFFQRDPDTGWTEIQLQGSAEFDTTYRVEVGRGVRTITGQRISNVPYRFEFRTKKLTSFDERYGTADPGYDQTERERRR